MSLTQSCGIVNHFSFPVLDRVEGLVNVLMVACGQDHCLAVCSSGDVFSWGAGDEGQLGLIHNGLQNCYTPR